MNGYICGYIFIHNLHGVPLRGFQTINKSKHDCLYMGIVSGKGWQVIFCFISCLKNDTIKRDLEKNFMNLTTVSSWFYTTVNLGEILHSFAPPQSWIKKESKFEIGTLLI